MKHIIPTPEQSKQLYMHATNIIALILAAYVVYETKQTLIENAGNIPVLILGMFPVIAATAISVLTFFTDKDSLLRVLYIVGIYTSSLLGA